MNRRTVIVLVVAAVLVAGGVIHLCVPKEPRYQDRTLTQWLQLSTEDSRFLYVFAGNQPDSEFLRTQAAMQAMGTNAIPFLLKWSYASDSKIGRKIISWLNAHLPERFMIWDAERRRIASDAGFGLLGDKARPAWPVFVQWTYDKDSERRWLGLHFLVATKADKDILVPVLRRLLEDSYKPLREAAAVEFCYYYQKEAAAAGVYQKFPDLHLQNIHSRELPPQY